MLHGKASWNSHHIPASDSNQHHSDQPPVSSTAFFHAWMYARMPKELELPLRCSTAPLPSECISQP